MAEKVTTVIAFVVVCVGFLVVLALVVQVVDSMGASDSRSLAAERRERLGGPCAGHPRCHRAPGAAPHGLIPHGAAAPPTARAAAPCS
jgi:hypothetical protein